ncbi:hypothetical protein TUM3792_43870 [Shewanella sp. MBTL60-007]|nr:hypothetical protein TUM3792_43870 [Shewanella sp. MBTL60-007]
MTSKTFYDGKSYKQLRLNIDVKLLGFLDADRPHDVSLTKHITYILTKHRAVKETRANGKQNK